MKEDCSPDLKLNALQVDEKSIEDYLGKKIRESVEDTINTMLDQEADELCGASRYERSAERTNGRAGHYTRQLHTKAGKVAIKMPKLREAKFETQIIERYRRREASVEEALMEMYLAGVSVRRVEDITEALWGTRVSASTVSDLNKKLYDRIDQWRTEPIKGEYPYVFMDGIWMKRCWGGEVKNVAILIAVGVDQDGYRQVLGIMEGAREDKTSWRNFLRHLKDRGLKGVRTITSDKCLGLVESIAEFYPDVEWQRCLVHWYRNLGSLVPKSKLKKVMDMAKALHAQESLKAAQNKAKEVIANLKSMKLPETASFIESSFDEIMVYHKYPREHQKRLRSNNMLERANREIRRRTRVVGSFPDAQSALMLVAARLRYMAGKEWGTKRYMNMEHLYELERSREPIPIQEDETEVFDAG